jgi:hypothetical protein
MEVFSFSTEVYGDPTGEKVVNMMEKPEVVLVMVEKGNDDGFWFDGAVFCLARCG